MSTRIVPSETISHTDSEISQISGGVRNNYVVNNDFELGDNLWVKGKGWSIRNDKSTTTYNGLYFAERTAYGIPTSLQNLKFKSLPERKYKASARIKIKPGSNGYGAIRILSYDVDGVSTIIGTGNTVSSTDWELSEVQVTMPIGSVEMVVEILATNTAGSVYVDEVAFNLISLTVIEDGSITTVQLATGSITSEKLAVGAVTAQSIVVGAVGAAALASGAVTDSAILPGTISGDRIVANSITADQIDASAINVNQITLNTTGFIRGGQTAYNTGSGFWQGYDVGAYKISFGNSTQGFTWDGTNFAIKGGSLNINNLFTVSAAGSVVIKNAASGQRLEISNSVIQVYDSGGVLRVRLGLW